jgi:hypothetical protein
VQTGVVVGGSGERNMHHAIGPRAAAVGRIR